MFNTESAEEAEELLVFSSLEALSKDADTALERCQKQAPLSSAISVVDPLRYLSGELSPLSPLPPLTCTSRAISDIFMWTTNMNADGSLRL